MNDSKFEMFKVIEMNRYLSENKSISKMLIALIAIVSVMSISITCLILREVNNSTRGRNYKSYRLRS